MYSSADSRNFTPRAQTAELQSRRGEQVETSIESEYYEGLISPHLLLLGRWVKSKTPQNICPDDVVQQTLLLAWKHLPSLRDQASVRSWLCAIALNVIRGYLRSPDAWKIVSLGSPTSGNLDIEDSRPSPLESIEQEEAINSLYRGIKRLPKRYRIVIELLDLKGCSSKDTMNQLSMSRTALKSRHFRARRMLLRMLQKEERSSLRSYLLLKNYKTKRLRAETMV